MAKRGPQKTLKARPAKKQATKAVQQRAMKAAMVPEKRAFDTVFNVNGSSEDLALAINLVPIGNNNAMRSGNQIRISGIKFKFILRHGDTFTLAPVPIFTLWNARVIVVHDKAVNGVNPVITDIYTDGATTAFRNMNQVTRFEVLYDKVHEMTPPSRGGSFSQAATFSSGLIPVTQYINWSKSGLNIPVLFNNDQGTPTPTVANLKTSGIFIIFGGMSATNPTFTTVNGTARITYFDA